MAACDAGHADSVVRRGCDVTSTMCPMAILVVWVAIVAVEVVAVHIVHVAIAVIVDSVARNLPRVRPHHAAQVLVVDFHAGVDDCHNCWFGLHLQLPQAVPSGLDTHTLHAPLPRPIWIVHRGLHFHVLLRHCADWKNQLVYLGELQTVPIPVSYLLEGILGTCASQATPELSDVDVHAWHVVPCAYPQSVVLGQAPPQGAPPGAVCIFPVAFQSHQHPVNATAILCLRH
mmetsp:Transcript_70385/g.228820  ORF Transcript_70385/g.228820 Transcript_70385/m.228820 type:complete len:230 (+) Transcript_70385:794-1483(+)